MILLNGLTIIINASTTTSFDVVDVIKKVGGFISKSASEVQTTARHRKRYAERYANMLDIQKKFNL